VVRQLTGGVAFLLKKHKVDWVNGAGKLTGVTGEEKTVEVTTATGEKKTLTAPRVLLATGSVPTELPFLKFDGKRIVDSTGALTFPEVPKHLVVIGGGVIGLELGSVWLRLGAKVTVVEFQDRIVPMMDKQIGQELYKTLVKQGMEFKLATKCLGAETKGAWTVVKAEEIATGNKFQIEADYVLVATGRRPYSDGLGLENVGISKDKVGRVDISDHFETSAKGVYAVGDLVRGAMLAHKAEEEAVVCVEMMAGQHPHINYDNIPGVVYTWPELACVGWTEEEVQAKGLEYKVGTFPFMANGRAKAMEETDGMVKIISDKKTDEVLGIHILGPRASDMIAEAVIAKEFRASAEDIARTSHAHPTLAEVMKEAALAVDKMQRNL
jgi:dihydrolipoamide dehydrogenase